jgi:serine protease
MTARTARFAVLLLALLTGGLSPSVAAQSSAEEFFVVGFLAAPPALDKGDTFLGASVERVDRTLRFVRVATSDSPRFVALARADSRVRYVEPDPEVQLINFIPNDPRFDEQYGPQHVRAPEAWDTTLGDLDARVCILDTGVRYTHEDITGVRWLGGTDLYNGDSDPMDDNGHGTHVTGIAAASINNAKGIAGIANVGIHGVKVLSSGGTAPFSTVASGIRWCADNGGPRVVINLSLGGETGTTTLRDAVVYAHGAGALLAAAAGNGGPCSNCVEYPAKYSEVIAVTCTTSSDTQCSYSSDGPESDLAAPGDSIRSLYHTNNTAYVFGSGTSMSTPHVAGVAALLWSHTTGLTNVVLRDLLQTNARDLGAAGWDQLYGFGLVDAKASLDDISSADLSLTKSDDPGRLPTGRTLTYTLTVTNAGPDAAGGAVVTDTLPSSVTFGSATSSLGTCSQSGGTVTCTLGSMGIGATATIQIVVTPTEAGTITNTASVSSSVSDPSPTNNTDSEPTSVCRITSRRSSIPCG